jgi:hypothetical protein
VDDQRIADPLGLNPWPRGAKRAQADGDVEESVTLRADGSQVETWSSGRPATGPRRGRRHSSTSAKAHGAKASGAFEKATPMKTGQSEIGHGVSGADGRP